MIDNNQKGFPKKNQRFGSSNDFVLVCGRTFREYALSALTKLKSITKVTFSEQDIPSVLKQRHYETLYDGGFISTANFCSAICHTTHIMNDESSVDFTGNRVRAYIEVCQLCEILWHGIRVYLMGYNESNKSYKRWVYMPKRFETILRDKLNYVFSKLRTTEHNVLSDNSKSFQRCNTSDTNPSSKLRTKFFIPAVSLRN